MKLIICLDENDGFLFNNRRQSQDKYLRNDILDLIKDKSIYMNKYSYSLYKDKKNKNIKVCDDFLEQCSENDYCLVENIEFKKYEKKINTIIIYKWNRIYPADTFFDMNLKKDKWILIENKSFLGYSHDKITRLIYRRIL
ncbi:ribonuclease Z (plasmid) [Clostridium perfringens]|uniref:Uncharacterized protein n=2 Tax=Clostridium perfringens TaxID=1502 RepID=A0A140GQ53_CLOPF|nr:MULTISPECIES: hypothetical protein [Clostridium]AMN30662.1 hypothetical protein JFP838_pC0080 [Clostridium perfringens]MDK7591379.1 ribonuclease Z [Clostridium sp. UMB9555B]MDK7629517.1 ribonuclease Z [Clostridium sp. UMB9555A]